MTARHHCWPHLVDARGVALCPEATQRDAMSDGEFWEHVFGGGPEVEYEPDAEELQAVADLTPCPECGEFGPCAYDVDGRALVHLVPEVDA